MMHVSGVALVQRMEYFYDHQTDKLSLTLGDFADYGVSKEILSGVFLHIQRSGEPLAVEIAQARAIADVAGLVAFEERTIAGAEIERRLSVTKPGLTIWSAIAEFVGRRNH